MLSTAGISLVTLSCPTASYLLFTGEKTQKKPPSLLESCVAPNYVIYARKLRRARLRDLCSKAASHPITRTISWQQPLQAFSPNYPIHEQRTDLFPFKSEPRQLLLSKAGKPCNHFPRHRPSCKGGRGEGSLHFLVISRGESTLSRHIHSRRSHSLLLNSIKPRG